MTTATDWDVRDRETNDRLTVTDVQAEIDRLDGAATDGAMVDVHRMADKLARVQRRADMLAAENAELRKRLGGWTPQPQRVINGESDLSPHERMCAMVPPTADYLHSRGNTIAAEMVRGIDRTPGWPTWLGDVHHADATYAETVASLRSWPEQYAARDSDTAWDDALRALTEPVAVDYSYRRTEEWALADLVVSQSRQHDDVYAELAPERIQDPPADESGQNREATPPDDRVDRMTRRVNGRLRASQPETPAETPVPRRSWWRRAWHALRTWDGSGA